MPYLPDKAMVSCKSLLCRSQAKNPPLPRTKLLSNIPFFSLQQYFIRFYITSSEFRSARVIRRGLHMFIKAELNFGNKLHDRYGLFVALLKILQIVFRSPQNNENTLTIFFTKIKVFVPLSYFRHINLFVFNSFAF